MNDVLEALRWRYATKIFSPQIVCEEDLNILLESLRLAPSSYGLQPWRIDILPRGKFKDQVSSIAFDQPQIQSCSHLVVLSARNNLDINYINEHIETSINTNPSSQSHLHIFKQAIIDTLLDGDPKANVPILSWAQRQTYIALGILIETAAILRIDACPMEGFVNEALDKHLGITKGEYSSTALVALGYRSPDDTYQKMQKTRFSKDEIIFFQ
ncbi:NAD(P)H-dependent oxidoreductase [Aurantivibrio infirmus]